MAGPYGLAFAMIGKVVDSMMEWNDREQERQARRDREVGLFLNFRGRSTPTEVLCIWSDFSNIVNLLSGERSEPKVDVSQSKHYWGVRSMVQNLSGGRKPGAKFQQDRSSRSKVMAQKPVCLF